MSVFLYIASYLDVTLKNYLNQPERKIKILGLGSVLEVVLELYLERPMELL
jgi:hypothetical protein